MNSVEKIAKLVKIQISSNSYKDIIKNKLFVNKWYMYNYLTVYKQMADVKLNYSCHIAILETIYMCSSK